MASPGCLTNANWEVVLRPSTSPICLAVIILIFLLLRKELLGPQPSPWATTRRKRRTWPAGAGGSVKRFGTVDAGGQLFLFEFGLVILAPTWARRLRPDSANVIAPSVHRSCARRRLHLLRELMGPGKCPCARVAVPAGL